MVQPVASWTRLIRMLTRKGRSPWDAEDLVQEALLRLEQYRKKAEVRNKEAFLTQTVRNLAISLHRRERVVAYANESLEDIATHVPLIDSSPSPDRILEAEQRFNEILRVLGGLSERARQIYLLNIAGYRYQEIAQEFGVSIPTVERDMALAVLTITKSELSK